MFVDIYGNLNCIFIFACLVLNSDKLKQFAKCIYTFCAYFTSIALNQNLNVYLTFGFTTVSVYYFCLFLLSVSGHFILSDASVAGGRRIHVSNLYFCTRPLCQFNHRGVNVWILIMQDMAVDPFWSMGIMSSQKVTEHSQKPILCCSGEVGNI